MKDSSARGARVQRSDSLSLAFARDCLSEFGVLLQFCPDQKESRFHISLTQDGQHLLCSSRRGAIIKGQRHDFSLSVYAGHNLSEQLEGARTAEIPQQKEGRD